jgi:SAM-dependent methyltransferase
MPAIIRRRSTLHTHTHWELYIVYGLAGELTAESYLGNMAFDNGEVGMGVDEAYSTDEAFDRLYPKNIRRLAENHFTPVSVARAASQFLVTRPGAKILDIGSGAGKFCLVGAMHTKGHFTGIEQRQELVDLSNVLAAELEISTVTFLHGNILTVNISEYDGLYLFNPFYENVDMHHRMDDNIIVNGSLYETYTSYVRSQMSVLKTGTRLATYYCSDSLVHSAFRLVDTLNDGHLRHWLKE